MPPYATWDHRERRASVKVAVVTPLDRPHVMKRHGTSRHDLALPPALVKLGAQCPWGSSLREERAKRMFDGYPIPADRTIDISRIVCRIDQDTRQELRRRSAHHVPPD